MDLGRRIWESGEEVGLRSQEESGMCSLPAAGGHGGHLDFSVVLFWGQVRGRWWVEEGSGEEPRRPSACVPTCACSGERCVLTVSPLLDGVAGQICRDKSKPDQERS